MREESKASCLCAVSLGLSLVEGRARALQGCQLHHPRAPPHRLPAWERLALVGVQWGGPRAEGWRKHLSGWLLSLLRVGRGSRGCGHQMGWGEHHARRAKRPMARRGGDSPMPPQINSLLPAHPQALSHSFRRNVPCAHPQMFLCNYSGSQVFSFG